MGEIDFLDCENRAVGHIFKEAQVIAQLNSDHAQP